jgi:Flp pilus assembly protein TadG
MSHAGDLLTNGLPDPNVSRRSVRRRIAHIFRRWRRDERGVVAVEFAFVALPFFALILGIIALGFRFFVSQALEAGLSEGARRVMTGQVQADATIQSVTDFRDRVLCAPGSRVMPDFVDCSKLVIDIRTINSFGGTAGYDTRASNFFQSGGGTFNIGQQGSLVIARIAYPFPAIASALTGGGTVTVDGQEHYALMAAAVFRNEPF